MNNINKMKSEYKTFLNELKLTGEIFFNGNHSKVVKAIAEKFNLSNEESLAILLEWVKNN